MYRNKVGSFSVELPQTTTGETPVQLWWSRTLRTQIDFLKPNVATNVDAAQARQKNQQFKHATIPEIINGSGNHHQRNNPVSARVELENGTIVHKHYDQLLARQSKSTKQVMPPPRQLEIQCEDAIDKSPQQESTTLETPHQFNGQRL